MKITIALLGVAALLSAADRTFQAPDKSLRVQVAEGSYSAIGEGDNGQQVSKRIDRWTLWREKAGTYTVESLRELPSGAPSPRTDVKSVFRFNSDFVLTRYELHARNSERKMTFICNFKKGQIGCSVAGDPYGGRQGYAGMPASSAFFPSEFLQSGLTDLPWTYSLVVRPAVRKLHAKTRVTLVDIEDNADQKRIAFDTADTMVVTYLGTEELRLAGHRFLAHKFKTEDGSAPADSMTFWTSDQGLLLKMEMPEARFELSQYREFLQFISPTP